MKHVVIVHSYKSKPETNWKPWLKHELETMGFRVDVPAMPKAKHPIASEWVSTLSGTVGEPSKDTFMIGHSLGCIAILRYLETLKSDQQIGGCSLIAGFGQRFSKYEGRHDSFFDHELDWHSIRRHCQAFVAIHSREDWAVEVEQLEIFRTELDSKTVTVNGLGHFTSDDGVFEISMVRDQLLMLAGE
jgi:predicted alpha/beta hydrolase family esterase